MTSDDLNSLREKDITQWLIRRGEVKTLDGKEHTTKFEPLCVTELLRVNFVAVAEARNRLHTTRTMTSL